MAFAIFQYITTNAFQIIHAILDMIHKIFFILVLVSAISCKSKQLYIISGNDTIMVDERMNVDVSKCSASSGHGDTVRFDNARVRSDTLPEKQ